MPEYIEKMKAVSAIKSYEFSHCPEYMQDWATKLKRAILQDIVDDVMEIPTADVAPVVHGDWIEDGYIGYPCVCSICGTPTDKEFRTRYCPNCGARMDGE